MSDDFRVSLAIFMTIAFTICGLMIFITLSH